MTLSAAEVAEPQFVEVNGNRLAVEVLGPEDAPVIIAHHGAPGLASRAEPRESFGRFADEYRVVVFDARGSGVSEGAGEYTHEQWAADIDGLRDWVGADRVVMAGGSYGGFMAMEYALRYPDRVRALVLRDTAPDHAAEAAVRATALSSDRVPDLDRARFDRIMDGTVRDDDDLRACWREILPLYDHAYDPATIAESVERKVANTVYRYRAHNYAFARNMPAFDLKPQLHRIAVPTLVTVGRTDWITPVAQSEVITALIPDARLVVFENSGHSPQMEEAQAWTATVRGFLHEVCPPAAS